MKYRLPRKIVNSLLLHAQSFPATEVCGLIGCKNNISFNYYPVDNIDHQQSSRFYMDPRGQIEAMKSMRLRDESLFAIFHSHPFDNACPSIPDLVLSSYTDTLLLICSLGVKGVLEIKGYYLNLNNVFIEVELDIF